MKTAAKASPAKLRNGSWGARVNSIVAKGDTVTITTRAGKSWDAIVGQVIWSGNGVTICATENTDRPSTSYRSRREPMGPGRGQAVRMPGYSSYCTDNDSCGCYDCAS